MNSERRWLEALPKEDLDFLKEFILASGSLKELAKRYEISYPTVRVRLNRLIELVKVYSSDTPLTPLESELRILTVRGEISRSAAEKILRSYTKTIEAK
jgi:hypothetical protein